MTQSSIVTFLANQKDFTGSVYSFTKSSELSTAAATKAVIDGAAAGDIEANVVTRNGKDILTACLSRRAVRRINRAKRAERASEVETAVVTALRFTRPQKIGPLVVATGCDRREILDVLRAGRDREEGPVFLSQNTTKSNFHMAWTLVESPEAFPVAAEAPAEAPAEVEASGEAEGADAETPEEEIVEEEIIVAPLATEPLVAAAASAA